MDPGEEIDMAPREDAILVIGPGPVSFGQGSYPQYLAARACRILRKTGLRVCVLENDPATLMDMGGDGADLYMEPPTVEVVERIVDESGVRSIWYSLGGRRALLLALKLEDEGWHKRHSLATPDLRAKNLMLCGNRYFLRQIMEGNGLSNMAFKVAASIHEGQDAADRIGFPLVARPHFSYAGRGSGLAYNLEEYPILLQDALRESPIGEVLIEKALVDWRKYIVLLLRDRRGRMICPGIIEQMTPLPIHDGDSILACPPVSIGGEGAWELRETARRAADELDLLGLSEIKLAVSPEGEQVEVLDMNPCPSRHTPLLEIAMGVDWISIHLDLIMGRELSAGQLELDNSTLSRTMLTVPRLNNAISEDEGYLSLACQSGGRNVFLAESVSEAAGAALDSLSDFPQGDPDDRLMELLTMMRAGPPRGRGLAYVGNFAPMNRVEPICLCRAIENLEHAILLIAGEGWDPGAGYEFETNCSRALEAPKKHGDSRALYTSNPDLALYSVEQADAVLLGPLEPGAIIGAAKRCGLSDSVIQFGGPDAFSLARELQVSGLSILGWTGAEGAWETEGICERLKNDGVAVVDCITSKGIEEGLKVLAMTTYPLHATSRNEKGVRTKHLIYSEEDGERLLRELPGAKTVIWREVPEDVQEVQIEAVAGVKGDPVLLLWEQLDEAGISSTDGLAVYPPFYMTSAQEGASLALAREAIDALALRGNLSMKIFLRNSDLWIWDISLGASANLPFLHRASGLPLAAYGIMVLEGEGPRVNRESIRCSLVRAPIIPYGAIADSDILPSPQRRSTGAVIGIASSPAAALAKALCSQGLRPQEGRMAFLSVANREKRRAVLLARELKEAGYDLMATRGTAHALTLAGIEVETVNKLKEGRPNIVDHIRNGGVGLVINIPRGKSPHSDGFYIRAASARHGVPCITNIEFALALARGLRHADPLTWEIMPLQEYSGLRQEILDG